MKKFLALLVTPALIFSTSKAGVAAPIVIADPVAIIAHKTGPLDAPENTHQGITVAKQKNANLKWVEVDIRWNKSHFPHLMHDVTVDKTTNYAGNLKDYWFTDTMKMDAAWYYPWNAKNSAGGWVYPQYHGNVTDSAGNVSARAHPSYAWEFLNAAKNANVQLLLDVKDTPDEADADKLYDYLTRFGYTDKVTYMSNPDGIKAMRSFYPDLDYIIGEYPAAGMVRTIESIKSTGASGIGMPYTRITKTLVNYYHSGGIKIFTWTSDTPAVDVEANWTKVVNDGVDALITNQHVAADSKF